MLEIDRPMVAMLIEILVMLELVVWLLYRAQLDFPDILQRLELRRETESKREREGLKETERKRARGKESEREKEKEIYIYI